MHDITTRVVHADDQGRVIRNTARNGTVCTAWLTFEPVQSADNHLDCQWVPDDGVLITINCPKAPTA